MASQTFQWDWGGGGVEPITALHIRFGEGGLLVQIDEMLENNDELHNLCASPNIRVIKSKRIKWVVAC